MRKAWPLAFLALPAAQCAYWPGWNERLYVTQEELDAPPTFHAMKAAFIGERERRGLNRDEGLAAAPSRCDAVVATPEGYLCRGDRSELQVYPLGLVEDDRPRPVVERVFYCARERRYYYHYKGGPRDRDAWLGPYPLDRRRPAPAE